MTTINVKTMTRKSQIHKAAFKQKLRQHTLALRIIINVRSSQRLCQQGDDEPEPELSGIVI